MKIEKKKTFYTLFTLNLQKFDVKNIEKNLHVRTFEQGKVILRGTTMNCNFAIECVYDQDFLSNFCELRMNGLYRVIHN